MTREASPAARTRGDIPGPRSRARRGEHLRPLPSPGALAIQYIHSTAAIGVRSYLAGKLTHSPETLMQQVRHPQQVVPGNAMPDMGVTEEDARHIVAHLYTLR